MPPQLPAQSSAPADHQHARAMPGSVGPGAIEPASITSVELADGSVGTSEISSGAVTAAKLGSDVYGTGTTTIDPDDTVSHGSSAALSRTDHQHPLTTSTPAALIATDVTAEGSGTTFVRNDHQHGTQALPWGLIARQAFTTSATGTASDALSDFALNNVSVVAGRWYRISLHTLANLSAAAQLWRLVLRLNGSDIAVLGTVHNTTAVTHSWQIDGSFEWEAPTTQATDDFTIFQDITEGAGTLTLTASSTIPRHFSITDIGPGP